jgi:50S ribosomal protein L16 3-hydroxylase
MAAQKTGNQKPLPPLGGLSAKEFLRDYWQKKPLLVRQAFPDFAGPLSTREVLQLARYEDAESRLITRRGQQWSLQQGPLGARDLAAARDAKWTVLVQDTQHFSHEAHALLAQFDFIPRARIDDLMVSYAVPGGGVGPHLDSYDVFLLQGHGRRRWQISAQRDHALKPGMPLKILARFKPEQEWVLETGDMLYLPPGIAHHGVAENECLTWSIGCRAPSRQELAAAYLDYLRDELAVEGHYEDPGLAPATQPAAIDAAMQGRMRTMLSIVSSRAQAPQRMNDFLGRYLTEPKSHVFFDAPESPLSPAVFTRAAQRSGLVLDLRSRMLHLNRDIYINGERMAAPAAGDAALLRRLADRRRLAGTELKPAGALCRQLHAGYLQGYLHLL